MYRRAGTYTVRVEATTEGGHTFVAERQLVVRPGRSWLYLPALARAGRLGTE